MNATLFRHEFLRTKGMLGVIAGIVTLLAVVGCLLGLVPLPLVKTLGMIVAIAAAASFVPVVLIALAVDYWRSAYGRTGYFTHSIPAAGSSIFAVRLVYGALVCVAALAWSALLAVGLFLVAASHEAPAGRGGVEFATDIARGMAGVLTPGSWFVVVLAVVVMAWLYLVQYYFAATVGSGPRLSALGAFGPILVWVVLYLVMQVLFLVSIVAVPLGATVVDGSLHVVGVDWMGTLQAGQDVDIMPVGFLPVLLFSGAVLLWWTARSWNRVSLR